MRIERVHPSPIIQKERSQKIYLNSILKIDSSTIDGNVKFIHSQYSCILTSQVLIPRNKNKGKGTGAGLA